MTYQDQSEFIPVVTQQDKEVAAVKLGLILLQFVCRRGVALDNRDQAIWCSAAGQVLFDDDNFKISHQALGQSFDKALRKIRNRMAPSKLEKLKELLEELKAIKGPEYDNGQDIGATSLSKVGHACDRFLISRGMNPNDGQFNPRN